MACRGFPLIRARLPASAIAAPLGTTADHVLLAASRNPAPCLPDGSKKAPARKNQLQLASGFSWGSAWKWVIPALQPTYGLRVRGISRD